MKSSVSKAGVALVSILGAAVSLGMMQIPKHSRGDRLVPESESHPGAPDRNRPQNKPESVPSGRATIVAIIDTGIDIDHPALRRNVWVNPGESGIDRDGQSKEKNGIDDDENGYVDDVHGYDFTREEDSNRDEHGHGTHIAGIIQSESGDRDVRYMSLVYYRNGIDGESALKNSIEAVRYAIAMNADIINYSGGGNLANSEERAVFEEASRKGILVVAAAGNEASNSEKNPFFPANYHLPNIISVTATDGNANGLLPSSNFGEKSVAVAAPGKDIRSTVPGGGYGLMTGTSQATAFVTAAAVRILQSTRYEPSNPSPELVIEKLVTAGSVSLGLRGKTRNSTHLNRKEIDDLLPGRNSAGRKIAKSARNEFRLEFEKALRQKTSAGHGPL